MKEPDFLFEIADFPLDKPIIITHSDFQWDEEKKEIIRVDKEHIYYQNKKATTE